MQILNVAEIIQVNGGIYNELLLTSIAIFLAGATYKAWDALNTSTPIPTSDPNNADSYYDGALWYLNNGGHCA